jgi:hypothetical protein
MSASAQRQTQLSFGGVDYAAYVGNELVVKGTFWSGGSRAERERMWRAVVLKHDKEHVLVSARKECLLLSFPDVEDSNKREFWVPARGGSGSYEALLSEHKKREVATTSRAAALLLVEGANSPAVDDGDGDDESETPQAKAYRRYMSIIKPFYLLISGPHQCSFKDYRLKTFS